MSSSKLPADREFVDETRKIRDSWLEVLKTLERLLKVATPENAATLLTIIQAAQDAEDSEDGDSTNIFELPINTEPLISEDYFIGWKSSDGDARRFLMSLFQPVLISTTSLAATTSTNIDVPSGYKNLQIRLQGGDTSASTTVNIRFSEDGGSTFLTQAYNLFSDSFNNQSASTTDAQFSPYAGTAIIIWGVMDVFDYTSSSSKFTREHYVTENFSGATEAAAGGRVITSTAEIDTININVASGTIDAGTVELWGIP